MTGYPQWARMENPIVATLPARVVEELLSNKKTLFNVFTPRQRNNTAITLIGIVGLCDF